MVDSTLKNFKKCDVFTPDKISKLMSKYLFKDGDLLEPAVGIGNLIKFISHNDYDNIDVYDIKKEYLDKCNYDNITKYNKDFIKSDINKKYKNIILNPPFIKIQDLSKDYIKYIKNKWSMFKKGNIDIYYIFLLKCLELLDDDGIMVSITPNSFLYNKSSTTFRKYLIDNQYISEIIDFKNKKVFKNVSVYCCVTIFTKNTKNTFLYNNKTIYYNKINNIEYNIFNSNSKTLKDSNSKTLKDICNIKNGIATLRDNIYIHKERLFNEPCWKTITNSKIEKFIIFPYDENSNILNEDIFKKENPKTYKYLENHKIELSKRDKGKKKYPMWYSFGRTQSLKISKNDNVLYMPTFLDPENIIIKKDSPMLFHSCLCIEAKDNEDLDNIYNIIIDNKDFIINNSPKRGGGWITISTRILNQIIINK